MGPSQAALAIDFDNESARLLPALPSQAHALHVPGFSQKPKTLVL